MSRFATSTRVRSQKNAFQKAYEEAHERLKAKFEEKVKVSNYLLFFYKLSSYFEDPFNNPIKKFREISSKLSPAAKTATEEVVAVVKVRYRPDSLSNSS